MQTPIRSSYFWMASQTSKGEGQTLSSGPWLWMASLMSNSLTSLSRADSESRVGLQTMVGMPASRAYSNALRSWDSSSVMPTTPQLSGVMPASWNCFTTALRSSAVLLSGKWASLIETYFTPTRWTPWMAASSGSLL